MSPTSIVRPSIEPSATGARLGTVTVNSCVAVRPSVSVAVTDTVAVPFATAVTVSASPDTATPATSVADDSAAYTSPSPSGSRK